MLSFKFTNERTSKTGLNSERNISFLLTLFGLVLLGLSLIGGGKKAPLSKISHIYPTMMKLVTVIPYLKRSKKHINHVTHPLSYADIRIFLPEISNFCYIKKYGYRLHFNIQFLFLLIFLSL